jgi:hypothetical protein
MHIKTSNQEMMVLGIGDLKLYCPMERTAGDFYRDFGAYCPEYADHTHDSNHFDLQAAKALYYPCGGKIIQNPYFIHPDIWLAQNFPEYMQ